MLANAKKLTLFAAGAASQKYMQGLADQQEVMGALADCIMEVFALESCILRAEKLTAAKGERAATAAIAMTRYYAAKAAQTVELFGAQGNRGGGRRRHAAHPDGDPAPPRQARAGRHHRLRPPDRQTRSGRREILAVKGVGLLVAAGQSRISGEAPIIPSLRERLCNKSGRLSGQVRDRDTGQLVGTNSKLHRLPNARLGVGSDWRTQWTPQPKYSCCPEVQIRLASQSDSPPRCTKLELVVQGIGFDLGAGQSRMIVIQLLPRDEVPDNPAPSVFLVVKVNQSFIRDHPRQAQNGLLLAAQMPTCRND